MGDYPSVLSFPDERNLDISLIKVIANIARDIIAATTIMVVNVAMRSINLALETQQVTDPHGFKLWLNAFQSIPRMIYVDTSLYLQEAFFLPTKESPTSFHNELNPQGHGQLKKIDNGGKTERSRKACADFGDSITTSICSSDSSWPLSSRL